MKTSEFEYDRVIGEIQELTQEDSTDFPRVIQLTKMLLKLGFIDSQVYFFQALAHQILQDFDNAKEFYKKSISISDKHSQWTKEQSLNNITGIYFDLDEYDECIEAADQNIKIAKNDEYKANAQYLAAHAYFMKTYEIEEDVSTARASFVGKIKRFELDTMLNNAKSLILKALLYDSENVDYLYLAGRIYKKLEDFENAKLYLRKAASKGDRQALASLREIE